MSFDPSALGNLMLILTGFGAAFAVSLWISLIIWTYRDIRHRTRDHLVHILAIFVSAVLFIPGVLIYLILRPPHTLDEEYERALEEESLLASIELAQQCPGCNRRIKDEWLICPDCHTRLKKTCRECGKPMDLGWDICPVCGTPEEGMLLDEDQDQAIPPVAVPLSGEPPSDTDVGDPRAENAADFRPLNS